MTSVIEAEAEREIKNITTLTQSSIELLEQNRRTAIANITRTVEGIKDLPLDPTQFTLINKFIVDTTRQERHVKLEHNYHELKAFDLPEGHYEIFLLVKEVHKP